MSDYEVIREKIRTFYYSTLIPINLIEDGKIVYSIPEKIDYIGNIIKNTYLIENTFNSASSIQHDKIKPFHYNNEYDECYIIMELEENRYLMIGPTLNEKIYEGYINNMIRQSKLPIRIKNKLVNYYESLQVIDSNRYHYCGKLLETLFKTQSDGELKNEEIESQEFLPDRYFTSMIENRQSLFHHPPYFLEQEMLSNIRTGNLKDAMMLLREINSLKRSKLANDTLRSIKNSLICSITLFTRAAIEGGVQPDISFTLSDSIILEIESIDNITRLIDLEYRAVEQYVKIVQDLSKSKYSNAIQQALSYIHKNLTNKITLKEISSVVYVHPNYLSTIFKKEVGVKLPDYIMRTRIEESKYYIRYTNAKISEIALFYQFCNQSYFISAFKKYNGITPKEYRLKFNQLNG